MGDDGGMPREQIIVSVDVDLLERARHTLPGRTDAALLKAGLESLLRERESAVNQKYLAAYQASPVDTRDDWGDLSTFLDEAARK